MAGQDDGRDHDSPHVGLLPISVLIVFIIVLAFVLFPHPDGVPTAKTNTKAEAPAPISTPTPATTPKSR
jgi:hypothetical protein